MAKTMKDVLSEQNVKPLTNVNGTPLVTYKEQRDMNLEMMKDKLDIGVRQMNKDGSIAKSRTTSAAINEDIFFDNRYRVVGDEMQIITAQTNDGYRAIKEQRTGRVFAKLLPAYALKRDNGKLVLDRLITVSDSDFISEFTHRLNKKRMEEVLLVLKDSLSPNSSMPEEDLPI